MIGGLTTRVMAIGPRLELAQNRQFVIIRLRGRLQDELDDGIDRVASSLNLATKKELREMKRSLRRMEVELERAKR